MPVPQCRALGCSIGRRVCLYPHGADPMMTEPELVALEDGACVDDAALVAHVNSRGIFELCPLRMGHGAALRAGSKLMAGAVVEVRAGARGGACACVPACGARNLLLKANARMRCRQMRGFWRARWSCAAMWCPVEALWQARLLPWLKAQAFEARHQGMNC